MDEILPGLFLGDLKDANQTPEILKLCMLEGCPLFDPYRPNTVHVPILRRRSDGEMVADTGQLNLAADMIYSCSAVGKPLLVHCGAGVERSPLTMAWFLHRKLHKTLDEAYAIVIARRPMVQRRDQWLENLQPLSDNAVLERPEGPLGEDGSLHGSGIRDE